MPSGALNRTNAYSLGLIIRAAFLFCAVALLLHSGKSPWMQTLSITFVSIVLEAFPFMLLGTLVGGFIEEFVSREKLASILPQRKIGTVLIAASMGIVFPVCECAVVPVTRRFLRKGIPFSAALAYLLAGPIVNPIVFASTSVAYGLDWGIALIRGICGFILALLVSSTLGLTFKKNAALSPELGHEVIGGPFSPSLHGHATGSPAVGAGSRVISALLHAAQDFVEIATFLIMGAFLAAGFQSLLPRSAFFALAGSPALSIIVMMLLAVILSLCSEADAFVAASFRLSVPLPGQMAFMVLGPMLDLKLILMYVGLFRKRFILALAGTTLLTVFLAMLLFQRLTTWAYG